MHVEKQRSVGVSFLQSNCSKCRSLELVELVLAIIVLVSFSSIIRMEMVGVPSAKAHKGVAVGKLGVDRTQAIAAENRQQDFQECYWLENANCPDSTHFCRLKIYLGHKKAHCRWRQATRQLCSLGSAACRFHAMGYDRKQAQYFHL